VSFVELVGWGAALIGTLLGLPQVFRLARTRSVEGLSMPAWQAILGLNIGWASHGILLGQTNMIVPNILGLASTLPILVMMSRELERSLPKVLLPGVLVGALMIGVDLAFGTAVFGVVAIFPAFFANFGQCVELIRSPSVAGVSPVFLIGGVVNQVFWFTWGLLVNDAGTIITATVTLTVTAFNLVWWILRQAGLRSFGVPTRSEVRAYVRARSRAGT